MKMWSVFVLRNIILIYQLLLIHAKKLNDKNFAIMFFIFIEAISK